MGAIAVASGAVTLNVECDDFTDPWREAPTLLLVHGFGRSSRMWYPLVPTLARHFRVLRLDLRGLGKSSRNFDPLREITLDHYVRDLGAVLQALAPSGPVHLCGESIGSIASAAFAALHPAAVRSLTLVATPAFLRPQARETYACGFDTPAEAMTQLGAREWLRRTNGSTRFPPDMDPGFLAWFNEEIANADPGVLLGMSEFILRGDLRPYLPQIAAPTLLIYPSGGKTASDEQCQLFLDLIPDVRVHRIPTSAHMVHLVQPEACAQRIRAFVQAVEAHGTEPAPAEAPRA